MRRWRANITRAPSRFARSRLRRSWALRAAASRRSGCFVDRARDSVEASDAVEIDRPLRNRVELVVTIEPLEKLTRRHDGETAAGELGPAGKNAFVASEEDVAAAPKCVGEKRPVLGVRPSGRSRRVWRGRLRMPRKAARESESSSSTSQVTVSKPPRMAKSSDSSRTTRSRTLWAERGSGDTVRITELDRRARPL